MPRVRYRRGRRDLLVLGVTLLCMEEMEKLVDSMMDLTALLYAELLNCGYVLCLADAAVAAVR